MSDAIDILNDLGIQPTPQRLAVLEYLLRCHTHPSADQVLEQARRTCPTVSRATVYNTLNLLVEKGLLKTQVLREGTIVYDRNVRPHHHFIDESSGRIYDIPWDAIKVTGDLNPDGFEVAEYQVILRGRRRRK